LLALSVEAASENNHDDMGKKSQRIIELKTSENKQKQIEGNKIFLTIHKI